jgi:hypothetical protein
LNTGGVLGRLVPPLLADRVGAFNVLIPLTFAAAACVLALLAVANAAAVIVIALLYGALNAGCTSFIPFRQCGRLIKTLQSSP